jgi:hypothetical protein
MDPAGSVRLFDLESTELLACGHGLDGGSLMKDDQQRFCCTEGNGRLLVYFFGKGKRDVRVQLGQGEGVVAHLGTRWNGSHREWTLEW